MKYILIIKNWKIFKKIQIRIPTINPTGKFQLKTT